MHYRLYFLDIANHIRRALDLECADDQEAIGSAKNGHPERPLELWRGAQRVLRLDPCEQAGGS